MHKYPIVIDYSPTKVKRLKKFCQLTDTTVKDFCVQALDNEIAYQIENMEPAKRKAVEKLLSHSLR